MRTIDIMYPLLFTTATGALVTILWFVAGKILERMGFLHITYRLLKLLMFFWIVPIAYVILSKLNSHGYRWYGDLFCPTGFQIRVGRLFVIIWGIGVLVALGFYIVERIRLKKRMMLARPCDDEETRELYIQVCRELNLKPQKVRLCLSEYEKTPIVAGVWHPMVYSNVSNCLTNIKNQGYSFVARYYSKSGNSKRMTAAEAAAIGSAGLKRVEKHWRRNLKG